MRRWGQSLLAIFVLYVFVALPSADSAVRLPQFTPSVDQCEAAASIFAMLPLLQSCEIESSGGRFGASEFCGAANLPVQVEISVHNLRCSGARISNMTIQSVACASGTAERDAFQCLRDWTQVLNSRCDQDRRNRMGPITPTPVPSRTAR
jgi:hypothetical protein